MTGDSGDPGGPGGPDRLVPAQRLTVTFRGGRSTVAGLTWSQRGIWELHGEPIAQRHYLSLSRLFDVPAGATLTDVAGALRWLVERYEALRTTVAPGPGGVPYQHIAATGEYVLDVHEAGAGDAGSVARRLAGEYQGRPFSHQEWPLRVAVITQGGVPARALFTASHLALDRCGLRIACRAFASRLAGREAGREVGQEAPETRHAPCQPADQAEAEASAAGRRMAEQAARYWRHGLRAIPQTMFPFVPPRPAGRWSVTGELTSTAAALAAASLAARHGTTDSGVILAATAALLGARTGNTTVAMRLLAANRDDAGMRQMVGTCVQPALFTVDTDDASFGQLIERAGLAAAAAYRHARYPAPLIDEATRTINACRGINADLLCHFSDATDEPTGDTDEPAGDTDGRTPDVDPDQIEAARSLSRFRTGALFTAPQKFLLEVSGQPGTELALSLTADQGYLSRADVAALVRGIETLLVEAVRRDFPLAEAARLAGMPGMPGVPGAPWPAGVAPSGPSPAAVRIDHCWVEPAAVAAVLAAVPGVAAARAEVADGHGGSRLIGTVAVRDPALDAAYLHREVMRLLRGHPAAMAPQHYLIHLATGDAPVDLDVLPRCGEGPGRPVYTREG